MKFELWNQQGCFMDSIEANSFREERKHFNDLYTGDYRICFGEGESKNVKLR